MTSSISLTLQGVTHRLPDGRLLFSDLNEAFDARPTGLVGRNGVGKSVLARILAGQLIPTAGHCLRHGTVYFLPQQIKSQPGQTVADLASIRQPLDALRRIESGSTQPEDFDALNERWDIRNQLQQALQTAALGHLDAETLTTQLSGGEAVRVALMGAFLSGAATLILDEPTNHLDRANRAAVLDQLARWRGGLIVVSHDRELLGMVSCIVELSSLGLRRYGGNYDFYADVKERERTASIATLEQRKIERRREERTMGQQRDRLSHRSAQGTRKALSANQAPILVGRQKERSEASSSKLLAKMTIARQKLTERVHDAAQSVEEDRPVMLFAPEPQHIPERVAVLHQVVLPYGAAGGRRIDLTISKGQRLGVVGPNGSGKSTLINLLAGSIAPVSGRCEVFVRTAIIDQHQSYLSAERSVLEQLLVAAPATDEGALRTRLALMGLDAARILLPTAALSGGERVKAALAQAIYADQPAQLLLLDEPSNHLDLASVLALEGMLRQYRGAMVVSSHDTVFLQNLQMTRYEVSPATDS